MCVLAVAAILLGGCAARGPAVSGTDVPFMDEGATQQSGYEGTDPKIEIRKEGTGWLVTVFQGAKTTGGYAVRVEQALSAGTQLRLRARFTDPATGAITTAVLSSPAHTIGIGYQPDEIVLFDQDARERARARP